MGIFTLPAVFSSRKKIVPAGLIIPYNGTSAPSGWSLFTDADGRFIVGAGSSYSVGATGGSLSVTTNNSSSSGAHAPTGKDALTTIHSTQTCRGLNSAGGHTHTVTFNYTPPYYTLRLIKANKALAKIPANGILLSGTSLSGLTRFSTADNKYFKVDSTVGSGGSNTISGATSSSDGSHAHGSSNSGQTYAGSGGSHTYATGNHSHPAGDFTITPALKAALLSAWYNASSEYDLQSGVYAFYESTTPPSGWLLCNGSNGTLDLRDYFVKFVDEDSDGNRTGDNTITISGITLASVDNSHSHMYYSLAYSPSSYTSYHLSYSSTHSHTISSHSKSYIPPYYALAIIQLAA